MAYLEILEHSYAVMQELQPGAVGTRLEYLADYVFGFTTYDSEISNLLASKAVDVCAAINDGTTTVYIRDADSYRWYLIMVNMPFFAGRLNWGTSIRGAWWDAEPVKDIELESAGIWLGETQCLTLKFPNVDAWRDFIAAVIDFAAGK